MPGSPSNDVVKRGTFLYDGAIECGVEIVQTNLRPGSGDREDDPEIQEDAEGIFFEIRYQATGGDRRFSSGVHSFETVEAAMRHAEAAVQVVRWIV